MRIFFTILFILNSIAQACLWPTIAETTTYYTPDAKKICGRYGLKCPEFVKTVKIQGSGKLNADEILRYTGKVDRQVPGCATVTGAAGICLVPYISVAADSNYYNIGDIISMPAMKGQEVKAPDGSILIHPGFFIVHDVGGDVDGRQRFDFYTGPMGLRDENNSFGYKGAHSKTTLYAKEACDDRKKFSRIKPKDSEFAAIKLELEKFEKLMLEKTENTSGLTPSTKEVLEKGQN